MKGELVKAEGAGNDFLIGSGRWADRLAGDASLVVALCHRRRGIGADGTLALHLDGDRAIRVVHRNADGSRSAFCANGTRCAARVAVDRLGLPPELVVRTDWAPIPAEVDDAAVILELPPPTEPRRVSLTTPAGRTDGWHLWVGVPHLVVPVVGLDGLDLDRVAPPLRSHPDLGPAGANVHFVEPGPDGALGIRSLERGVDGEVLCCGSGVVAAALVAMADGGGRELTVLPRSAEPLVVRATSQPPTTVCRLAGPARIVAVVDPLGRQNA